MQESICSAMRFTNLPTTRIPDGIRHPDLAAPTKQEH